MTARTQVDDDNTSALYGLALSLASGKDFRRAKAFLDKARTSAGLDGSRAVDMWMWYRLWWIPSIQTAVG